MKILSIIMFLLIGVVFYGTGQTLIESSPFKKIDGQFSSFYVDDLGNVFALTSSGQLKKYNTSLDSLGVFNDVRRFGSIHSVSSGNPLRTILYFKGYRTILVLDRLLQVVNKIDLRKNQLFQVQAVSQSYDNGIWVFDEQDSRIKKIGLDGALIFESSDLRLALSESIQPSKIFECNGLLYMYDFKKGLYGFDYYGAFKSKVALLEWNDVQVVGDRIVGLKNNKLMVYGINPPDIREYDLSAEIRKYQQLHLAVDKGYGLTDTGLEAFRLKYK